MAQYELKSLVMGVTWFVVHRGNNEWHKINAMAIALIVVHRGNGKQF